MNHKKIAGYCLKSYPEATETLPGDLEYLVVEDEDYIVVSVRGSEPPFREQNNWKDWITNFRFFPWRDSSVGLVHAGWLKSARRLADRLVSSSYPFRYKKIIFTGHSLGAAIAIICAQMFSKRFDHIIFEVVLFGCPKCFVLFRPKFNFKVTSYRHGSDAVTKIPHLYRSPADVVEINPNNRFANFDDHDMGKYFSAL